MDLEVREGETWASIPGHPGYIISNYARVRSLSRSYIRSDGRWQTINGRELVQNIDSSTGYYYTSLGSKASRQRIHRLMAITFIPNPDNLPVVRHLNDIRTDNRLDNLAWGTVSDNQFDRVINGTWVNGNIGKTHCKRGHPLTVDNLYKSDLKRICKTCRREYKKSWRKKRKELGLPKL